MCRQHSYISVPGITRSSTKWQVMNQSSGSDVGLGADQAEAEPAAGRVERAGPGRPASSGRRAGGPGRAGRAPRTPGPNAAAQVAPAEGVDLAVVVATRRAIGTSVDPVVGPDAGQRAAGRAAVWTIPLPAASASAVKNPAQPSRIVSKRLAVDRRLEPEPEQVRVPLAEEPVDLDVVADHLARARAARGGTSRRRRAAGRRPAPSSRSRCRGSPRGTGRPGPPRRRCRSGSGRRRDTRRRAGRRAR